jgi:hypothetical protein
LTASLPTEPLQVWLVEPDFAYQLANLDESGRFLELFPTPSDGSSMISGWETFRMYIQNPLKLPGDFVGFLVPILRSRAMASVGELLKSAGEVLPVEIEGEGRAHAFNCTSVIADAFDSEHGQRRVLAGKWLMEPTKYAFHAHIVEKLSVFKIPQNLPALLCASGGNIDPERDFYRLYHEHKLTGLIFRRVWRQEPL